MIFQTSDIPSPQILEFINNLGKICFPLRKMGFQSYCEFCRYCKILRIRKGPESFCQLFDVLPEQACKIKEVQVLELYFNEKGATFM